MDVPVTFIAAAVGWAAICVNLIVLPFFSKRETLFKELIDSGARDASFSYIDAQRLIPSLASIVKAATEARQKLLDKGQDADYTSLLQEVDFVAELDQAQLAMAEKRGIEADYERVNKLAAALWKVGILHSVSTVCIPLSFFAHNEILRVALATLAILFAILSLLGMTALLLTFDRRRTRLYSALGKNRGK